MKKIWLAGFAAGVLSLSAHATSLIGTSVTGEMMIGNTNYFDPARGYVPSGYLNKAGTTVNISSSDIEFGFQDNWNLDTANFTGNTLTLTDVCGSNSIGLKYQFVDKAFDDLQLSTISNSFPVGMRVSLDDDTLTIYAPSLVRAGSYSAEFSVGSAAPEPASYAMMLGGLGFAALLLRRRRQQA